MTTETQPTTGQTIHDAIDALFAEKAGTTTPAAPVQAAAVSTPPAAETSENQPETTAETQPEITTETAEKPPEAPKVSASDYALQLSKAKKKIAAAEAKAKTAPGAQPVQPSAEAIKRAAAIEAAGGDPVKAFEAAGFDLKAVIQAYEKRVLEDPEVVDPLAQEVKTLSDRLAQYERAAKAAEDAATVASFFDAAKKMIATKGSEFEYVAKFGDEGLDLVKTLVVSAAEGDEEKGIPPQEITLAQALKLAEAHYEAMADKMAQAEKLRKKIQPASQTKKPGLPQGAPAAGVAPATTTAPRSVQDVINQEIDALLG
jgi:hypothetical protein